MSEARYTARTLPQVIAESAAAHGAKVAITDGDVTLTYAELETARIQSARAFLAAGLGKGERIAIWAPNIHEWIVAALGAHGAGAAGPGDGRLPDLR